MNAAKKGMDYRERARFAENELLAIQAALAEGLAGPGASPLVRQAAQLYWVRQQALALVLSEERRVVSGLNQKELYEAQEDRLVQQLQVLLQQHGVLRRLLVEQEATSL